MDVKIISGSYGIFRQKNDDSGTLETLATGLTPAGYQRHSFEITSDESNERLKLTQESSGVGEAYLDNVSAMEIDAISEYNMNDNAHIVLPIKDNFLIANTSGSSTFKNQYINIAYPQTASNAMESISIGEVALITAFKPLVTPEINIPIAFDFSGVSITESFGGKRYSTQRFDQRRS